jgi:hypothetical protein
MLNKDEGGMMKDEILTQEIIDLLIEAGKMKNPFSEQAVTLIASLRKKDEINRLHWREWNKFTENMEVQDLVSLTKGLTVAERHFQWSGGSVAGVIWVYRMLQNKDREVAKIVGAWVKENTNNPYAP